MTLPQWWRAIRGKRLVVAEVSWDDPLPTLYALSDKLGSLWGAARRRLS